ncbi:hypothetical protein PTKIN_Ptkin02bG0115800 [Pterospermum kingtungense]
MTNQPFNKEAMMGTMKIIWKLSREVTITAIRDNLFLFKFHNRKGKEKVIEGVPWSFNKYIFLFHDFKGELRPLKYVFQYAIFWLRIYDLPLGLRKKAIGEKLVEGLVNSLPLMKA